MHLYAVTLGQNSKFRPFPTAMVQAIPIFGAARLDLPNAISDGFLRSGDRCVIGQQFPRILNSAPSFCSPKLAQKLGPRC